MVHSANKEKKEGKISGIQCTNDCEIEDPFEPEFWASDRRLSYELVIVLRDCCETFDRWLLFANRENSEKRED